MAQRLRRQAFPPTADGRDGGNNATDPSTVSLVLDLAILGLVALGGTIGGSLTYDWGVSGETAGDHPAHPAGELDRDQPKHAP